MNRGSRADPAPAPEGADGSTRAGAPRGRWLALLFGVVLVALALRTTGIGFLMPGQPEPDGVVYEKQVQILREGVKGQESQILFAFYPHLVARLVAALPSPTAHVAPARTRDEHVARASASRVQIRTVVAWLSLLAVPATWWIARRFVPDPWALGAAFLVATSVLVLWFSQQARPHAPLTSFATLAVAGALLVRERGGVRAVVVAGLALGLAIACLQNGLALLPAFLLALVLRARAERSGRARLAVGAALGLALVAVCVRVFYPFLFAGTKSGEIGAETTRVRVSGHVVDLTMFDGRGAATVARTLWEYDPLITALALLGVLAGVVALWRARSVRAAARAANPAWTASTEDVLARDRLWIVLAFVVPYLVVLALYARTYQRFCTPLVPFAAIVGAYGAWRVWSAARARGRVGACLAGATCLALVGVQAFAATALVRARARPDTIREAAAWIEGHVDPARRIAVLPTLELPLLQSQLARNANHESNLDVRFPWFSYLWQLEPEAFGDTTWNTYTMPLATEKRRAAARADTAAFVAGLNADYAVVEVFSRGRFPLLAQIRTELARIGTLETRLVPDRVDRGEDLPFVYQDDEFPYTTPWFARTLGLRCTGPAIEIYSLRRDGAR